MIFFVYLPKLLLLWIIVAQTMMPSRVAKAAAASGSKQLYIIRHGQATHNPRAEAARSKGCSQEEFMELMRQDDSLDSELTELGQGQAESLYQQTTQKLKDKIQLLVSSPLSRTIQTANLAMPQSHVKNRVCVEDFREINGYLLNAKRRTRTDLRERFPAWNFDALATEEDTLWTPELESQADCSERGYQGLSWILKRPEDTILLVCHGGILRFVMNQHELVNVIDGRICKGEKGDVKSRFGNCELRRYSIGWDETGDSDTARRTITLTELDQE